MPVDYTHDLLVLTGASGNQAALLIPLLVEKWKRLRLVVNSASSQERLAKQYGSAEIVRADLAEPKDASRVVKGATAVFHVGASFHPHEKEIGYNMIDAAIIEEKQSVFKHFVYSSVLNALLRKMMNHDCKRYVEEYLIESGLNYTILQPTHFLDLFPVAMLLEDPKPVFSIHWDPSVPFSFIALKDLSEAAAKVLTEREAHYRAQYPLCSDGPLSYNDVCAIVGKEIGKDIRVERKSYEEGVAGLLMRLFGEVEVHPAQRDAAQRMILYYNYRGLTGNTNVLGWLLGRKPTTVRDWAKAKIAEANKN